MFCCPLYKPLFIKLTAYYKPTVIGDVIFAELWAVVNNAGVFSCYGPDDWCKVEDYQSSMDVNFLGIVRVTQVSSTPSHWRKI